MPLQFLIAHTTTERTYHCLPHFGTMNSLSRGIPADKLRDEITKRQQDVERIGRHFLGQQIA